LGSTTSLSPAFLLSIERGGMCLFYAENEVLRSNKNGLVEFYLLYPNDLAMRTLSFLLFLSFTANSASGQSSSIDQDDAVRISEAYSLSTYIGESIWNGWSETPFAILLLTPEKDYLIGHPYP